MVVGALIGAVIGYGIQQAIGQDGWALLIGAAGMNAGAFWAAIRCAEDKPPWPRRRVQGPTSEPSDSAL
jgi:hypothetical protein